MGLQYEIAGNQIDGARDYQEDTFLITHLTDAEGQPTVLVIVADGMGGHAAGNVASNMAVQAINKYISSNYPADDITGLLQGGVLKANASIAETIRETPALQGMGCTMVAALLEQDRLWWASVGDSHLYLLRDKELTKKNADHSYGGFLDRLAAAGQPMEPEPGLSRNMLMSAVTGEEITEIDCPEEPLELKAGDRLVLCSDGLDTLSSGKIIQFAEWSAGARDYVQALLDAVEEAAMPRQDNTTTVVINILEKDAAAVAPPAEPADEEQTEATEFESTAELETIDAATDDAGAKTATGAESEPEASARPEPVVVSSADLEPPESREKSHAGRGGLIAIAAGVVIAILVVAYLFLRPATEGPVPVPGTAVDEAPATAADDIPEPKAPAPQAEPEAPPTPEAPAETPAAEPVPTEIETFADGLQGGGLGPVMASIPGGSFKMGSNRFTEERPEHTVEVQGFAISQYEITIAEYERFARATGSPLPETPGPAEPDYPVVNVSWPQAVKYTEWLSQQTGHQYRLPSEAEWEYAASAGRDTDYWWGVTMEPNRAHCFGCNDGPPPRVPIRVGSFAANPFGLHDTEGNVAEWVQDCWHKNYEGAPATAVAWVEGGDCSLRVVRGGSYNSPPTSLRNARRDKFKADQTYDNIGFRVVREVD